MVSKPQNSLDYFLWHAVTGENEHMQVSINNFKEEMILVTTLWEMITTGIISVGHKRILFYGYKTQVAKALFLSLSGAARLHMIQFASMFRYAIDSMIVSIYSFHNPKEVSEIIVEKDKVKKKKQTETLFSAAYKWLEVNEDTLNKKFKQLKTDVGSKYGAHVHFANTAFNIDIDNLSDVQANIFDNPNKILIRMQVLLLADISILYLKYLIKHEQNKKLQLDSKIKSNIDELSDTLEKLREKGRKEFMSRSKS